MTTGRINQVTVRPSRRSAQASGEGTEAPLGARSPRRSSSPVESSSTSSARARRRSVVNQRTERHPNAVNLVPRSHTPQVAFPAFAERGSAPSVETANANGRPRRGCKRNAADLQRISCCRGIGHRQSIHYLSRIARKRRAEARSRVSTSGSGAPSTPSNRAQSPSRAGTSC